MSRWILLPLCLILGSLSACQNESSSSQTAHDSNVPVKIFFIPKIIGNAFFDAANEGAQKYAKEQGFEVEYIGPTEASVSEQVNIVQKAINEKIPALAISALDPVVLEPVLKQAMASGVKVVTWDADVPNSARQIMISQGTPQQLGQMLVEMGAKSLAARGKNPAYEPIKYLWHYSQPSVKDQNSWRVAAEAYIKQAYPHWQNIAPKNFYSEQNYDKALEIGQTILTEHPDVDLIICNDSTALPAQTQVAQDLGLTASDLTITGFASPNVMRQYLKDGVIERWGLWDCQVQGALACYVAYQLALGRTIKVGDHLEVPGIGFLEVMPDTVLDSQSSNSADSGVILLPNRLEFTLENINKYNF